MAQQESEIPRLHPEKIGNYRIVRLIGEGGMGRVYEAIHDQIQRRAAIKVLHAQFAHNSEAFTRFLNEARAVNIVQHPGVVNVFEFGQTEDGSPYIVMEFLEGESLSARLERLKFMSLGALRIARQLASALVAAHSKHIIHRDLKPSNIMLVPDPDMPGGERVKVVDFGIAKMAGDQSAGQPKTRAGAILGTPLYMSPEQCRGAGEVTEKSDIYSMGVMLYEMLVGRTPFVAEGEGEIMGMHLFKVPPPLHSLAPTLPLDLVNLVHSMLAKDPAQRPTIVEVARELDRIGQRLSDQTHSAPAELAEYGIGAKPPGPKTLPIESANAEAAKSAEAADRAAPALSSNAVTPTITAPSAASLPSAASPPPPAVTPAADAGPVPSPEPGKAALNQTAVVARSSTDKLAVEQISPPAGRRTRLLIPISAAVLVAIAGASGWVGLSKHRSRPAAVTRAQSTPSRPESLPSQPMAETAKPAEVKPMPQTAPEKPAQEKPAQAKPAQEKPAQEKPDLGTAPERIAAPTPPERAPDAGTADSVALTPKTGKGPRTDNVTELAEQYVRSGQWLQALNLAKVWGDQSANPVAMRRIFGISACHLKQLAPAQQAYTNLKGDDRKAVALACRVAGMPIPEDVLRDAERLLVQKSWAEAMAAAQSPQLPRPLPAAAWRIIGVAACQLRDFPAARAAASHLEAKDKAAVEAVCQKTRPEKPTIF